MCTWKNPFYAHKKYCKPEKAANASKNKMPPPDESDVRGDVRDELIALYARDRHVRVLCRALCRGAEQPAFDVAPELGEGGRALDEVRHVGLVACDEEAASAVLGGCEHHAARRVSRQDRHRLLAEHHQGARLSYRPKRVQKAFRGNIFLMWIYFVSFLDRKFFDWHLYGSFFLLC